DGWERIATCRERLWRPADEVEALEACLALVPERGHLWRRLGLLALQLGYRPRGMEALERALALEHNDATLQNKLAEALQQAARELQNERAHAAALDALLRSERFHGNDPTLFVELSSVLEALERTDEAISRIKRASILAPNELAPTLRLALLLLAEGELQPALASFQRATELEPESFEAWIGLGKTLFGLGKVPPAIDAYRKALAVRDAATNERFTLAVWLAEEGMLRDAAPELERVLQDNPAHADAARWLGRCLTRLERIEPSVQAWRAVLRFEADDVEALMGLGKALFRLGKAKDARFPLQQLSEQLESGELSAAPPGFSELWGRVLFALEEHELAAAALQLEIGRASCRERGEGPVGV